METVREKLIDARIFLGLFLILSIPLYQVKGQCTSASYPLELTASSTPQYISSPDYPGSYPANSNCSWRITAPASAYIILNVENITLASSFALISCIGEDKLTVYDGDTDASPVLASVCPNNENDVNSLFPTSSSVYIVFTSQTTPYAGHFNILYFANDSTAQPDCNGTVFRYASSIVGTFLSPSATASAVTCNVTVMSHLDNTFTFQIYYMNLLGGACISSSLKIYDGGSRSDTLLHESCTTDTVYTFSNITTSGYTALLVLDIPQGTYGVLLTYVTNPYSNVTCDNNQVPITAVYNTENYIESENFGTGYSNRLRCRWLLTAQNTSQLVEAYFDNSTFQIEYNFYCRYDYVILYDGSSSSLGNQMTRACGSSAPNSMYRTTGTEMLVFFRTDYSITRQGFRLVYKAVDSSCDALYTEYDATYNANMNVAEFRNFSSPNYDGTTDYPANSDEYWLFVNNNFTYYRLVVEIQDIKIEKSTGCIYDKVIVYNGSCITDTVVGTACGSRKMRFDLYNERHLVRFFSDGLIEERGFYAYYYIIPLPTPIPPTTTTVQNGPAVEVVVDTINQALVNYSNANLPTRTLDAPINATIDFYLVGINGLDEADQILTTTGQFIVTWTDGNVGWDPSKRSDMQRLLMPQNDVWRPDIVLMNGVNKISAMGASFMFINIDYNGTCIWRPYQVLETTCQVDMSYYPYDTQVCYLQFGTWSSSDNDVRTDFAGDGMKLHEKFTENSIWTLIKYETSEETLNSQRVVRFTLTIQRSPIYTTFYISIPLIMLAYINVFTFTVPTGSGEKSGFGITVFLSFVVVLIVVSDSLPRNSENISLFAAYILTMTIMSALATCLAVSQIRVMTLELFKYAVPSIMKRAVSFTRRITRAVTCFGDNKSPVKSIDDSTLDAKPNEEPKRLLQTSPENEKNNDESSRYGKRRFSWLEDDLYVAQSSTSGETNSLSDHSDVFEELQLKRELTTGSIQLIKERTDLDMKPAKDDVSENGSSMFSDDEVIEEMIKDITNAENDDAKDERIGSHSSTESRNTDTPKPQDITTDTLEDKGITYQDLEQNPSEASSGIKSTKSNKHVTFEDELDLRQESPLTVRPSPDSTQNIQTTDITNLTLNRSNTSDNLTVDSTMGTSTLSRSKTVAEISLSKESDGQTKVTIEPERSSSSRSERPLSRSTSLIETKPTLSGNRPLSRLERSESRLSRTDSRLSNTDKGLSTSRKSSNPFGMASMPFTGAENQPFSVSGRESILSEFYPETNVEQDVYDWEKDDKELVDNDNRYNHGDEGEEQDEEDEKEEVTWENVMDCSDVYLFTSYLAITTVITLGFFLPMLLL